MSISDKDIWERVSKRIAEWSTLSDLFLYGQEDSLQWISSRIKGNGVIIADEVGLGKTRLALLTMIAVLEEGGSVAAIVPPGLLYQWRQEAQEVMFALKAVDGRKIWDWKPVILRTYDDLFKDITDRLNYPMANPKEFRWVLISQTFDIYHIYSTAHCRKIELPALVQAHRAIRESGNVRNNFILYRNRRQRRINNNQAVADNGWDIKDKAAKYLSEQPYSPIFENLLNDDQIRPRPDNRGRAGNNCAQFFQNGNDGRKLLKHLMGKLIGIIDLLVIDEAHKSRDDDEKPRKRLGRLLGEILVSSKQCRRISMTATPIELSPDQWFSLLQRTGVSDQHPDWAEISKSIREFSFLLQQAHTRPDQLDLLRRLMVSAKQFEKALAPFVTRRRRLFQDEMQVLLPSNPVGAHPHRDLKTHPIEMKSLAEPWRKMVLALEGQGISSKGISSLCLAQKLVDIRYVSGLNCKFEYEDVEIPCSKEITRKEMRTRAWSDLQKGLAQDMSGQGDWLWCHPRIVHAADRIEELCEFNGLNPKEKVLVFGRFSEPMRALYKTLNLRHTLRIVDSGKVALIPNVNEVDLLFFIYNQQFDQKKFHGLLKDEQLTLEKLKLRVLEAHKSYEKKRDALRDRFHGDKVDWFDSQPGDDSLRRLKKKAGEIYKMVFDVLRADVFDHLLYYSKDPSKMSNKELRRLAQDAWVRHLMCIMHDSDEKEESEDTQEDLSGKITKNISANKELEYLDSEADMITPERFKEYLEREPRSHFCRLLDGSVHHVTRRSIQASFNRQEAGPYVLIAQSIVGREGLNLHKACRRVFLFHPEWNPGVTEQQIGRVDRIESLWTKMAESWKLDPDQTYPKIEVESLVFQGTYDEYQANILRNRRALMNAQLFGALLDEETMVSVPEDYRELLAQAAPDWGPAKSKTTAINSTEKIKKSVEPDLFQEPTKLETTSIKSTPASIVKN